jgi:hypothetical protein
VANRIDDRRERSGANEEHEQADEDPRHPTHTSSLLNKRRASGRDIPTAHLSRIAETRPETKSAIPAEP